MNLLDNLDLIKHLDTEDMYHKIIHMPEHILQAYNTPILHNYTNDESKTSNIEKIVICGMGGSAIAADLIKSLYNKQLTIDVCKDYQLPFINSKTLVITCSYSSETEETLSCLNQALEKTEHIWGVTTGGKLAETLSDKYPYLEIVKGFPPRSAIAYLFFSVLKILELNKLIASENVNVQKTAANLMMKAGAIAKSVPIINNLAKSTSELMNNKIPLFYASNPLLSPIAYRLKCQINENTKYPAFYHYSPEMNHNEIEAWENQNFNNKFIPVFLRFFEEDINYEKRLKVFKKLLTENGIEFIELFADGDNNISRFFSLIYLGDMISFYLAICNNTNPTTINFINFLKKNI